MDFNQKSGEYKPEQPQLFKFRMSGVVGSLASAIMISRILGLVREIVLARFFGAGFSTDAFYVAYRIPNLLRDLFAEGALSSAFIPTFVRRLTRDGKERAWLLANRVINALLMILGIFTLVFFFGAKAFVYLLASGYAGDPEKFDLTVQMIRIMSPFLLCVSLASVGMGMLNAFGKFFIPAMASSAFNICCILAGIFLSPIMPQFGLYPIISMAIGALVGGASQVFIMVPSAYSMGFRYRLAFDFADPGVRKIARLMLPAVIGLSATQINITVDTQIASTYGDGPVSWLNYGFRLMQLPVGVFGIAIATSTMAAVAHHAARNARDKLHKTVDSSLRLAACLTFPAMIGLIIFRNEIVCLLYERGSFLPSDTVQTGKVVLFYAFGLFSYSAVKILVPAFYALNDTRTPIRMSFITVAAKIVLNFILIVPLGFLGLALSTTLASWLNFGLLMNHLRRQNVPRCYGTGIGVYTRIAFASFAMGLLALLVFHGSGLFFSGHGFFSLVVKLGSAILISLASLIPLLKILKVEEGNVMLRMVGSLIGKVR